MAKKIIYYVNNAVIIFEDDITIFKYELLAGKYNISSIQKN